ncbi:aminotransferase class I/II-fold pyridoxal phosphate-dependent enzyme [Pseudodesulfovibrio cashew]|uniref:Histidinol-phosphate aminotransferase n=1 Tax=Pseudodesulfovibrio cashew TaxID=2678688 RepID=A0A6I6JI19_9BACT|nr:aminotransferase class I/II-fold pyridoxal phosphate-dependent enzyme [Pseudodesulfovibrio cashew]QGY41861.1 aminotransferase class I/II-fold pyridoxal phosphate-dependent enzyme [Pseudodesulfovibrio cashew]
MSLKLDNLIPEHIRLFDPYRPSPPDSVLMRLNGLDHLHRLNNNENTLGPSPAVRELLDGIEAGIVPIYPHGDSQDLREALSSVLGPDRSRFLVGNGSCELISSVVKAFCEPGDNIVTADKTFAVYEWVAEFSGIEPRLIPLDRDFRFDPDGMLAAVDDRTKLIFVCNPNNPTGTYWDEATMRRFLDAVDGRCIVVADEAYFEYVEQPDYPDCIRLLDEYPNLVVFRTFSKMYALAALRVGYLCAGEEVTDIISRAHVAYSVNTPAQMAARAAVLDRSQFIPETLAMVRRGRELIREACDSLGFEHVIGEGNYAMIRTPISDTLLQRKLLRRGFLVRTMTGFRFPDWIRVSLVREPVLEEFCAVLKELFR